ncbi:putative eukaryotic initiation factor 2B epsilon subunit [Cardiosporidium cionae]|uniref:Translation initiation factor eIF2B subunit epsilon n=1 Tax=Cardiosporidium cionae TaxID=476202 RepID=A0ABQ7J9Q4_9APIC|nr:putative eukaryotic initiation factor 2B epsilon subunit [Cardiosporidium cionae]|eukprot:KAF8820683.1 putative eukaryotic initiation factor 2B epsilon subunit [Cardiosporidium cionae]
MAKFSNLIVWKCCPKLFLDRKHFKKLSIVYVGLPMSSFSVGDMLRYIGARYSIRTDFILIRATSFTTADIQPAIKAHRMRKEKCPHQIMTKVFAPARVDCGLRGLNDNFVIGFDEQTNELLSFDDSAGLSTLNLDKALLSRNGIRGRIHVRQDVLDPAIEICSPQVLNIFAECFDWMDFRKDFIVDTITKEIKDEEIYVYTIPVSSAPTLLILDFRQYFAACEAYFRSVLSPHYFALSDTSTKLPMQFKISASSHIGPKSRIGDYCCIEKDCRIGENCTINNSFIGKNCTLGNHVTLNGCILGDFVTIEDHVTMDHSIVYHDSLLKRGSSLSRGCVLGSRVVIEANEKIAELSRISMQRQAQGSETDCLVNVCNSPSPHDKESIVGLNLVNNRDLSANIDNSSHYHVWNMELSPSTLRSSSMGFSLAEFRFTKLPKLSSLFDKEGSESSSICSYDASHRDRNTFSDDGASRDNFNEEICELVSEGILTPEHMQHKILEIKSLRLASNKQDSDVLCSCLPHILSNISAAVPFEKLEWTKYIVNHRIDTLINAFLMQSSQEINELVFDSLLFFFMGNPEQKSFEKADCAGPTRFCHVCEIFQSADVFDFDFFPCWHSKSRKISTEHSRFLSTPRLLAFVEWLQSDEDDA